MTDLTDELTSLVEDLAPTIEKLSPAEQWSRLADLGLAGIGVPEESGGSGGVLGDLLVVVTELARHGVTTPLVEGAAAAFALGAVSGDGFGTIVIEDALVDSPTVGDEVVDVPYATDAGHILVIGDAEVWSVLQSRELSGSTNLAGQPVSTVLIEDGAQVRGLGIDADEARKRLSTLRSAALLGSCQGAYELTKSFVQQREQFGAPLIKIPAVAASLADMAIAVRTVRSALGRAVGVLDSDTTTSLQQSTAVMAARIAAARGASHIARSAHQLHGAMGVTREYTLHRYTTALWAWRDADLSEAETSARLGALARTGHEPLLWTELTG